MYYVLLLLVIHISFSATKYSEKELDECLSKCGVNFDLMPEVDENVRSMGSIQSPQAYAPWSVLIKFRSTCSNGEDLYDRCSGFIISPDLIMTAAHCIFIKYRTLQERCQHPEAVQKQFSKTWLRHDETQVEVFVGYLDIEKDSNKEKKILSGSDIKNLIIPSEFDPEQLENGKILKHDYAVIQLAQSLKFGESVRSICLSKRMPDPMRRIGQMAGWGLIKENNALVLPKKLQLLTVPIQESDECSSRAALKASGFDERFHLCVGSRELGGLEGDSEAALFIDVAGRSYAIGLFSMVTTNSSFRNIRPDIYIKTSAMCDSLKVINGGVSICKPYLQELDISCYVKLRERRIELANLACGGVEDCQRKISVGEFGKVMVNPIATNGEEDVGKFGKVMVNPIATNGEVNEDGGKSADEYAEEIYDSIRMDKGINGMIKIFQKAPKTDTDMLISSNFIERREIVQTFKKRYNEDLVEVIRKELPDNEAKELALALLCPKEVYDAINLYNGMKGLGTDEQVLNEILVTRNNAQIRSIRQAYKKLFSQQLEADIADDTGGSYGKLLIKLCSANRNESGTVNLNKARQDASLFLGAGKKEFRIDEPTLFTMLTRESRLQLNATFHEYGKLNGGSIKKAFATQFNGDFLQVLNDIVQHAKSPARYFADRLHYAIKKEDNHGLIRQLVTGSEICNLHAIEVEFKKNYGISLAALIRSKSNAVTKHFLAAFVEANI